MTYDLEKAYKLAYKYFKNKVDKGGNPYMNHLMFVSNNCLFEDSKIVGLLHDILEDTDCSIAELESVVHENLIEAIQLLTKRKDEKYNDYIERIAMSKNLIAIEVKINDLKNNMDLTRLKEIKYSDECRCRKYDKAYNRLIFELEVYAKELYSKCYDK